MKRRLIMLTIAISLLIFVGCNPSAPGFQSGENPDGVEGVDAIENTAFHFDSYKEMIKAFTKYDLSSSSYTIQDFKVILGEPYTRFVDKVEEDRSFPQPMLDNEPITYRNSEGFANITFLVNELYNLPWIIYYPSVSTGENFYIKTTYLPDSIIGKQKNLTASEVINELSPNSPNINNLGKQHKSIYDQKIKLGDREVTALVYEYKTDNRNSTIFVYDDLLVEIRSDPAVWTDQWFSALSFDGR